MKKLFFTFAFSALTILSFAQNVGINTTGATPHSSAALDIDYPDKGLLIPRVALTSNTDVITIPAPATSLLVYNTNAAMTSGAIGYWYWDGAQWVQAIGPQGPAGPAGPAGANGATGPQGPAGANGATGPQGPAGANGATGATGPQGPTGPAGANGATGPQGPTGPAGANGATGATGPQGPAGSTGPTGANGATGANGTNGATGATGATGANGVTFMTGVSLTGDREITSGSYTAVPGMPNLTFTAQTTSVMIIFSASGLAYTNSMSNVFFRIRNGATTIGGTNTAMQSYDDTKGTITPWSCTYTRYLTGLSVGTSYTLSVQGYVNGIWGTPNAAIFTSSNPNENHMSLSVIQ